MLLPFNFSCRLSTSPSCLIEFCSGSQLILHLHSVNRLLELKSPSYQAPTTSKGELYVTYHQSLEVSLESMLRYFDIEIEDGLRFDGQHRFHKGLLDRLADPLCPMYELLGKGQNINFLDDFRKFRNYYKTEYEARSVESTSSLERHILNMDFDNRQPKWNGQCATL